MVSPNELPPFRQLSGADFPTDRSLFADGAISPVSLGDSALPCSNNPESETEACLRELAEYSAELVLAATKGGVQEDGSPVVGDDYGASAFASAVAPQLHSALQGAGAFGKFSLGLSGGLGVNHGGNVNPSNNLNNNNSSSNNNNNTPRPEWQKICIQHSVCIHNIYGNCAYGDNCYYNHLENFSKPDLLYKTELCRYGVDCVNRQRCCFAHSAVERRTPEVNIVEALQHNPIRFSHTSPSKSSAAAAGGGGGGGGHRHLPRAPLDPALSSMHLEGASGLDYAMLSVAALGGSSEMKRRFERQQQALRMQMALGEPW